MNVDLPLVTVGIALHNHERYIVQCVNSVLNQTYAPIELIILDDGSSDDSYAAIKHFLDAQTNSTTLHSNQKNNQNTTGKTYTIRNTHVQLDTQSNRGMCNTLNAIAKKAQGKYISFLGSDDYWMPDKLEDHVAYLETHPDITLVHSNSMKVNEDGEELKKIDYSVKDNSGILFEALARRTGGINTPSHLYRRSIFSEIGYYDATFSFEDTDFWLRLTKEHTVGYIDKVHTAYRWHGSNLSQSSNALKFYNEELISIYQKNIEDPQLLKFAVLKIYKKSIVKALQLFDFKRAVEYIRSYLQLRNKPSK